MKHKLNWNGHTRDGRQETINKVKSCLDSHDAFIVNFNMYSDLAMSMMIEVSERNIASLHAQLKCLLILSQLDEESIRDDADREWIVFLNISFGEGMGKLGHKRPSVPG